MHLSTSSSKTSSQSINNSSNRSWYLTWLLFILICFSSLTTYELFLKNKGYIASIENNKDLWSWYRNKATGGKDKVVIIGASRSQLDINIPYLKQKMGNHDIIQLSINGQYPMATLQALANDESFIGTLIVSLSAQALEPRYFDMQKTHNTYYANGSSIDKSLNAYLTGLLQSKLRFLHPSLGLEKIANFFDTNHPFQDPPYTTANLDQSISADYSKTDSKRLQNHFYSQKKQNYLDATPTTPDIWQENIQLVLDYVTAIEKRGGSVVLVRFPTDKGHWLLDEQFYPRQNYWGIITQKSLIKTVHFNDIKGLSHFDLPDSTHLDQSDSIEFTEILFNYLLKKKLIISNRPSPAK